MGKSKFASLSASELDLKERELRAELEMLNLKKNIGPVSKPSRFTEMRRSIAAIMGIKRTLAGK
jgi:ribosomal protein L29